MQKEKRASVDEMAGWLHHCNGHELDGEVQGGLVCCSSWGRKELDTITTVYIFLNKKNLYI